MDTFSYKLANSEVHNFRLCGVNVAVFCSEIPSIFCSPTDDPCWDIQGTYNERLACYHSIHTGHKGGL